jgi:tetrahydromethanopterin S-methyltransferase subunit B
MPSEADFAALLERIATLEKKIDDAKGVDQPGSTLFASGRVPFAAVNGVLTSSAAIIWDSVNQFFKLVANSLQVSNNAGTVRDINLMTAGVNRWIIRADSTTESGSNAGSNFQLLRRADDGALIDAPITINRATGIVTIDSGESWIAPTLLNSWVNYGGVYAVAGYYKDPIGLVHIKGLVKDGTTGTAIFSLPAGYRPSEQLMFNTGAYTGAAYVNGRIDITTGGSVIMTSGANGFLSLNLPPFRAA